MWKFVKLVKLYIIEICIGIAVLLVFYGLVIHTLNRKQREIGYSTLHKQFIPGDFVKTPNGEGQVIDVIRTKRKIEWTYIINEKSTKGWLEVRYTTDQLKNME